MKILITGSAGFIGSTLCKHFLRSGNLIVGLDKQEACADSRISDDKNFKYININICDAVALQKLFAAEAFDIVIHLAAQAGVRQSIAQPHVCIENNIIGFSNILENCRQYPVRHLIYASSSSVYGDSQKKPFKIEDNTDTPISLYAATKKSNELMGYSYSHLYGIPATGLRFFTVYGPQGRQDMAPMLFANAIMQNKPIQLFNSGKMWRDFTYVDDVVASISRLISMPPLAVDVLGQKLVPHRLLNCGRGEPVEILEFVRLLEAALDQKAMIVNAPMQPGDVITTWADSTPLFQLTGYCPTTSLGDGIAKFATWLKVAKL